MRPKLPVAPWLLVLDAVAVLLIGVGIVRLHVPGLDLLAGLPEHVAWVCIAAGGLCLIGFWVYFLRSLKARNSGD